MKVLQFLKRKWKYVLTALIALFIGASFGPSTEQLDSANAKGSGIKEELSVKTAEAADLEKENKELQLKIDEAAPFFKMIEEERKQKAAEVKAAEEKRLAAEKAKEEAEAKAQAEAEAKAQAEAEAKEKQGYNTGITYDQLARTPDTFIGEKVKFRGKVIQVMEGDSETQIRLAVNSNYDTIVLAAFKSDVVSSRVLEDDMISIYGASTGLITYESTMGGSISIPGVLIDKIDQ